MSNVDWVGSLAVVILSVFMLSYLLADDNAFFRMGAHLLVGISGGFLLAVMVKSVLIDQFIVGRMATNTDFFLIAMVAVFGLLLLTRLLPGAPVVGNIPMAYLVGVGAAVVIGGAIAGTLVPQVLAATMPGLALGHLPDDPNLQGDWIWKLMEILGVLIATITTLAYFTFGARPRGGASPEAPRVMKPFMWVGRLVVTMTLGTLYAGALLSSLTNLAGWWNAAIQAFFRLLQGPTA
jgi:hypothetical protein